MTSLNRYRDVHARIQACVGEDGQLMLNGALNHSAHAQVSPSSDCSAGPSTPLHVLSIRFRICCCLHQPR